MPRARPAGGYKNDAVKDVYKQPSESNPGSFYNISVIYQCSCLGWTRQRVECKHIRQVKQDIINSMADGAVKQKVISMFGLAKEERDFEF